ncbi:hypothetical protein F0562_010258 [Nyssa sinensis]|uniref:Uncharacterized protein n=1 Tax=Nyssa sinensis TaxID=561372 RepID=A0A5J4ZYC7_9ASTE|nr:hypothetical protein F0562_010258 [Nyssa sinensis]
MPNDSLREVQGCLVFGENYWYMANLDSFHHFKGSTALNQPKESITSTQAKGERKQMGSEEKNAVVHEEMNRMNQLPANSAYATHRLRVLNKILQLLSIERTISQDEELELLFAGLSI